MLSRTPDASVEQVYTHGAQRMLRLVTASPPPCAMSGGNFNTVTNYLYVRVYNPAAVPVRA